MSAPGSSARIEVPLPAVPERDGGRLARFLTHAHVLRVVSAWL
jgi:hypothetical protein